MIIRERFVREGGKFDLWGFRRQLTRSARSNKGINFADAKQITSMLRLQVNCTIQSIKYIEYAVNLLNGE